MALVLEPGGFAFAINLVPVDPPQKLIPIDEKPADHRFFAIAAPHQADCAHSTSGSGAKSPSFVYRARSELLG
jgi:hypothetical protein